MRFSIALCTYNGEEHLREQLTSLLSQTFLPAEVQVGDDGSTDGTIALLKAFDAPFPIILTENASNLGFAENFIQTSARCKHDWIAFCDQDDIWHPEKLERCAKLIKNGPADTKLIVHNARFMGDEVGLVYGDRGVVRYPRLSLPPVKMWAGFCQVFHRSLIEIDHRNRTMPWREERYSGAHDAWIPLLAGATGSVVVTGEELAEYRRHATNTTALTGPARPPREEGNALLQAAAIMRRVGLIDAAKHYHNAARKINLRRIVHSRTPIPIKLRAIRKLIRLRAYTSGGFDNFGRRGFIRDIRALLLF